MDRWRQWYRGPMCSRCQDAGGTGARPARGYGLAPREDRWDGRVVPPNAAKFLQQLLFSSDCISLKRLLIERYAAAPFAAIDHRRDLREATEFEQHLAEPRAILHLHIDKFKGHRLRTRAANNRLRLDVAHAVGKL